MNSGRQPPKWLDSFLAAPAALYGSLMSARNYAFDRGFLPSIEVPAVVVSVGNLSSGGTGKTPIVSYLSRAFVERGWKTGIVSRGYRGETRGPARVSVDGSRASARRFGDEPTWLAHHQPNVTVFVGADRVLAARALAESEKVDVIIADDGFQHRRLKRDLDIVLVDATQPRHHYRALPQGRLREDFASLARAHFVFVTKTNLAHPDDLLWLRDQVAATQPLSNFKVVEFEWRLAGFSNLGSDTLIRVEDWNRDLFPVLLVSGIARGDTFRQLVSSALGAERVAGHLQFDDHHSYSEYDLAHIQAEARRLKAGAIVVTEKDAVKLGDWKPQASCFVSRLEANPTGNLEDLYAAVGRLVL